MRRLAPLLADPSGEARFECRLLLDEEARPLILLRVQAELLLRCQASLEVYRQPIQRYSELGVIAEDSEEPLVPGHLDPVLAPEGRLALVELVEDELILAMPQVPRDPDFEPQIREFGRQDEPGPEPGPDSGRGPERKAGRKPFAELARLLDRERD